MHFYIRLITQLPVQMFVAITGGEPPFGFSRVVTNTGAYVVTSANDYVIAPS